MRCLLFKMYAVLPLLVITVLTLKKVKKNWNCFLNLNKLWKNVTMLPSAKLLPKARLLCCSRTLLTLKLNGSTKWSEMLAVKNVFIMQMEVLHVLHS